MESMTDTTITPTTLTLSPAEVDNLRGTISDQLQAGYAASTIAKSLGLDYDEDTDGVVLHGYSAADESSTVVEYPAEASAEDAAQEYVDGGDWSEATTTMWHHVSVWRTVLSLDDGKVVEERIETDTHTIAVEPDEPECTAPEHDWAAPHDVVGGLEENPGVRGHGGGVTIHEVCRHCAEHRHTDTWAQDPSTGEQGLTSVSYGGS
jgi:hypothetical protein